jgi:hypothetical protein
VVVVDVVVCVVDVLVVDPVLLIVVGDAMKTDVVAGCSTAESKLPRMAGWNLNKF